MSTWTGHGWPVPGSRGTRREAAGGFTIVELVVVVSMIALLAVMGVTSLRWLGSARQDAATTRVRTTLVFAHEWALGTGTNTWVAFDVPGNLVSVYVEDPLNPGKANRLTMSDPLTRAPMTLQLGVAGVGLVAVDMDGTSEVQFDARGTPRGATGVPLVADGTVDVTGGNSVTVTRDTGLVIAN